MCPWCGGRWLEMWCGKWLRWCRCEKPPGAAQPALSGDTMPVGAEGAVAVEVD